MHHDESAQPKCLRHARSPADRERRSRSAHKWRLSFEGDAIRRRSRQFGLGRHAMTNCR